MAAFIPARAQQGSLAAAVAPFAERGVLAGAVMLAGLPLCAVAGLVGGPIASMVMSPVLLGVRYVWWVAVIVARLS